MKRFIIFLLFFAICYCADAQSPVFSLPPDGDIVTTWVKVPDSGFWYTKIDDFGISSQDDDYIMGSNTESGDQTLSFTDPIGSVVVADTVISVRAISIKATAHLFVSVDTGDSTLTFIPITLTGTWRNYVLDLGRLSRSQISSITVTFTNSGCSFSAPSCVAGISATSLQLSNVKFKLDTP